MYEKLGRLMGRSYEETVTLLLKSLKNAEVILFLLPQFNQLGHLEMHGMLSSFPF